MAMNNALANRQILLGITGGIAAYKAAELLRRLQDCGADVRVVMTPAATEFITPLTLQALSGHPVHTALLDPEAESGMGHIELARWADLVVVAPASADFMARLVQGLGNDLLSAVCLATSARICLAPAMNQAMWSNPATRTNAEILQQRGITLWGPADGLQACGDIGPGRMLEVDDLVAEIAGQFDTGLLAGKRVLITAGPTREAIDPVRYISNHSSGKMGFALARACADAGAITTLIAGPVALPSPPRVKRIDVVSAQDMFDEVMARVNAVDIVIAAAAVADYRVEQVAPGKIKKTGADTMNLALVKTPDIIASIASIEAGPFTVGFAAETESVEQFARDKMLRKKLDMIIANDVSRTDIGFGSEDNAVMVFWPAGAAEYQKMSKTQLSEKLVEKLSELVSEKLKQVTV
ncbi:MAG: bifunctional phosphopantothenoylcysteine decarboxylase/phosphopantothenate--cysteine ligase CoaBC [Cellvibrionales bacterium]|nr:bifunctional phosphopantothenoylcysteine decarboxylase/phosphopantothenate--cysteine ligase CoaBC [Cellvibrionales bacterium]